MPPPYIPLPMAHGSESWKQRAMAVAWGLSLWKYHVHSFAWGCSEQKSSQQWGKPSLQPTLRRSGRHPKSPVSWLNQMSSDVIPESVPESNKYIYICIYILQNWYFTIVVGAPISQQSWGSKHHIFILYLLVSSLACIPRQNPSEKNFRFRGETIMNRPLGNGLYHPVVWTPLKKI